MADARPPAFRGDAAFRDDRFDDPHDRSAYGDPRHASLADELDEDDRPLADAGARLMARLIDGVSVLAVALPALLFALAGGLIGGGDSAGAFAAVGAVAGALALLVYQLRLLATEGQTVGKRAMKIRVVDAEDGLHPGFARIFWVRAVANGFIGAVVPFYSIIDALFVFRGDRRCIHDHLAKTVVVSDAPGRARRTR